MSVVRYLSLLLPLFLFSFLFGCSQLHGFGARGPESTTGEPPLNIGVVRGLNRNGILSVFVRVDAKTKVNARAVNLTLVGLDEGEERVHLKKNLGREIDREYLETDQPVTINFEAPATGLVEYQVRAEWGVEPSIGISRSEIVDVKNWCEDANCFKRSKLLLTLSNDSDRRYTGVNLAIGFHVKGDQAVDPTPLDLAPIAEGESEITLTELNLDGGEQRPLEIDIDQDIPVEQGIDILPYARILRVN